MQLAKNIQLVDLAVFLKQEKILIVSDFHIGFEESLNRQGMLVPRFQLKDTIARLSKIFKQTKPRTVVINGDLKHEFGRISEQEWTDTLKLLEFIGKNCREIILVKGNHDKILGPIAQKRNLKVVDEFVAGDTLIVHGNEIKEAGKNIKTVIIGHEHPAITLKQNGRAEKYKCFLKGKFDAELLRFTYESDKSPKKVYFFGPRQTAFGVGSANLTFATRDKHKTQKSSDDKKLIVMPSFNLLTEGTDVLKEHLLSPYLAEISNFEVFIASEKTKKALNFGKIWRLRTAQII